MSGRRWDSLYDWYLNNEQPDPGYDDDRPAHDQQADLYARGAYLRPLVCGHYPSNREQLRHGPEKWCSECFAWRETT